jgi:CRISPR/Cas system Type II protein with McrA/HNH and RuvC-like nuclease domain
MQGQASKKIVPPVKNPQPKSKFLRLFERDLGRCVYCGLNLKADFDRFMMATEDHLVPVSKGGTNDLDNLLLSCRTCNGLKANFTPPETLDAESRKREYIGAVRKHIMEWRAKRLNDFLKVTHPGIADYQ